MLFLPSNIDYLFLPAKASLLASPCPRYGPPQQALILGPILHEIPSALSGSLVPAVISEIVR
jgi:hypothetical protein